MLTKTKIVSILLAFAYVHQIFGTNETRDEAHFKAGPMSTILPPIKVGTKTYYVNTFFKANWYAANHFCRIYRMHLASIESKIENDVLIENLKATYGLEEHFWTSGNDLMLKGTYIWLSTGANFQFTNWGTGEPNNLTSGSGEKERCVQVAAIDSILSWNDKICSYEAYPICEINKE